MKKCLLLFILCCSLFGFSISASALSLTTYSDLSSTNSTAVNLVNYAQSFSSFKNADFVIVQDEQYSYYIVWGEDFTYTGSNITGSDVEYIRYYRTNTSGYNYTYDYIYGTDSSFNCNLTELVTSNIEGLGFTSAVYDNYKTNQNVNTMLIFFGAFLFVIMLRNLRRP